jgi:hypothetical protein
MQDLNQTCKTMYYYKELATQQQNATALARLTVSTKLCDDLTKLTNDSIIIYTSTLPLLSTDPHAKRYQSFPPIKNATRARQIKQVAASIEQLTKPVNKMQYPTQVLVFLSDLQTTIKNSKGLAYYPSLLTFQQKLMAERQQYWIDYGDLGGLGNALNNQLQTYCQNLKSAGTDISLCKNVKS